MVSPDDFGLTAREIILNGIEKATLCSEYAEKLRITNLLDRPFIQLSTGEIRKVLFCQILVSEPDLLILDEPFEGLDQASVKYWQELMAELSAKMAVVLISNCFNDISLAFVGQQRLLLITLAMVKHPPLVYTVFLAR